MQRSSWSSLAAVGRRVGALLQASGQTIAVSESATGGLVSAALLAYPGASAYLRAAHVAYVGQAQAAYVPKTTRRSSNRELKYGGEEYVLARAEEVAQAFEADWGIAESSQTGPTFISVRSRGGTQLGADGRALKLEEGEARAWLGVVGRSSEGRPMTAAQLVRNPGVSDREDNMFHFAQHLLELLEHSLLAATASIQPPPGKGEGDQEDEHLRVATELAVAAGKLIRDAFSDQRQAFEVKSANDYVTEVDLACEALILNGLRAQFPGHRLIGEESSAAELGAGAPLEDEPTWMVDPLDGTSNFIHRYPHVAVSIGLCVNRRVVVAVVHDPLRNETFTCRRGYGVRLNGRPVYCSSATEVQSLGEAMGSIEWPSEREDPSAVDSQLALVRNALLPQAGDGDGNSSGLSALRSGGSCVLDMAWVSCGRLDIAYRGPGPECWDVCAGSLLVEEAGGSLTGPHGEPFDVMSGQFIAASCDALAREFAHRHARSAVSKL